MVAAAASGGEDGRDETVDVVGGGRGVEQGELQADATRGGVGRRGAGESGAQLLKVPRHYLYAGITVFAMLGIYATS
ncbi:hypothetical protein, partial [Streptomyces lonarensis]|uniref:hypothetical protein n=1 Tax=Streptomyces lonarensis TaxID=700599 RepID=UPI0030C6751A